MKIEGEVRYNSARGPTPNFAFEDWVVIVQAIDTLNYVAVTTDANGLYDVTDIPVGIYYVTTRKDFSGTTYPVTVSWNNVQIGTEAFKTIIPEIGDLPGHFSVPSGATHVDFLSFATGVVVGQEYSVTYAKTFVMAPLKREYFEYQGAKVPAGVNLITDADNGTFLGIAEKGVINKESQTNLYPGITQLSLNTGLGTSDPMTIGEYAITNTRTMAVACPSVGSRMVDISQPVRVRPFARVGTVRSRCCGPVRQIPGIDPSPTVLDNCDFTIHQNICVQVPVEFGANVEVLDATSTCQGTCENCDNPPAIPDNPLPEEP